MAKPTTDEIVGAAKDLGQPEFTRADIASKLGVGVEDLKDGFRGARQAGHLEKLRDDADDKGVFKLKG